MVSHDLVKCQCCGKLMVPRTIFTRGLYGGWGWWVGRGRPVGSCCPFCLSEDWVGLAPASSGIAWHGLAALVVALFSIFLLAMLIMWGAKFFGIQLHPLTGVLPVIGSIGVFKWLTRNR